MKFAIKWTLGFLALGLGTSGGAAAAVDSPQIIKISDGHEYRFAGASSGTNHVLPGSVYPIHTREGLFIWLEPTGTNATVSFHPGGMIEIQGTLVDEKGSNVSSPCIANYVNDRGESIYNSLPGPPGCVFLWFPVAPRRSQTLECRLDEFSGPGGGLFGTLVHPDLGRLKFRNPLFGDYPQWQPEVLPAAKSIGEDVDVRLNRFDKVRSLARNGEPTYRFSVSFLSSRVKNENWTVSEVEVSDATGNRTSYDVQNPAGPEGYGVYGVLSPGESAVKLILTVKRTSGFLPSELMTFTNLPVLYLNGDSYAPDNGTALTNNLDGTPIAVRNILTDPWHQRHGPDGGYVVEVEIPSHPPSVIGDILQVVTETGDVLTAPDSLGPSARTFMDYHFGLTRLKFLNVTVAVQKTRTVEFLVKP